MTEEIEDKTYDPVSKLDYLIQENNEFISIFVSSTRTAKEAEKKITITGYLDRISRIVLYFKKDRAQRFNPSTFDIRHSTVLRFAVPWFYGSLFLFPDCRQGNLQPLYPGTRNTQPLNPACGGVAPCAKTQTLEPLIAKES